MTTRTEPPRPPFGTRIKYDRGALVIGALWQKWTVPLDSVTVQAVDNAGARKRATTLVFSTPDGATFRHRIKPAFADRALAWVAAFTLWQKAGRG